MTQQPGQHQTAPPEVARRYQGHLDVYTIGEVAYRIGEKAEPVEEKIEKDQDLSRELHDATDRLSCEAAEPVMDRRKDRDRSRDKRGR